MNVKLQIFSADKTAPASNTECGVSEMRNPKSLYGPTDMESLRLDPEKRLCPQYDSDSIALFPVAARGEMGVRVLDNFCEEHIM